MLYPEKLKSFDKNRPELKPYGFTVEMWTPKLMPRPDRHNEIEINLLTGGSITYFIHDRKIKLSSKRPAVFWALVPHQIIHFDNDAPYYVCTIPFAQFMNWQLPSSFVDHILKGDIVNTTTNRGFQYDKYLMEIWLQDISAGDLKRIDVSAMEIRAWLHRFALNSMPAEWDADKEAEHEFSMINLVEKIIIFIARNYMNPIKNEDIGKAVGLHPDYANTIFKKSFGMTLNQYVLMQRILHVERQLSVSNDSITEIAYEAGFNSLSRFNAAFREKCRCSPREYRKRNSSH
ncbi:MAG TPA: helix-turn-helix domain-containing protein [bacterium]|nr:helix-turn-helix domain-containing protein [bacterium]